MCGLARFCVLDSKRLYYIYLPQYRNKWLRWHSKHTHMLYITASKSKSKQLLCSLALVESRNTAAFLNCLVKYTQLKNKTKYTTNLEQPETTIKISILEKGGSYSKHVITCFSWFFHGWWNVNILELYKTNNPGTIFKIIIFKKGISKTSFFSIFHTLQMIES